MAFFRSLIESLGRNVYEDEFVPRNGLYPLKPTVTDSIGSTIKELRSIATGKGYVLIAVVPRSELINAVDLLQREVIVVRVKRYHYVLASREMRLRDIYLIYWKII